jgi:hypothetical protein
MGALRATSGKTEPEKTNDWLEAIWNLVNAGIRGAQNIRPPLVPGKT